MADVATFHERTDGHGFSGAERRVLQLIHRHGTLSRTDLVHTTGLSTASISIAVRKLVDSAFVEEADGRAAGPGRPVTPLHIRREAWAVLTIEVVAGWVRTAIVDAGGSIYGCEQQQIPLPSSPKRALSFIVSEARKRLKEHAAAGVATPIIGATVSVSGVVLDDDVLLSSGLRWRDVPLGAQLRRALAMPVTLINDMDARALAEFRYGAGKGRGHVLFVSIGPVGIGAGIVRNGQLYKGARGGAAELGHLVVDRHGLACVCGRRGCLDVYSSENAIVARAQHLSRLQRESAGTVPEIHELQLVIERLWSEAADNRDLHRIFEDAMDYFGMAVANLVTVLDPDKVVVGGHLFRTVGPWGMEALTSHVRRSALQPSPGEPRIVFAEMEEEAGHRGAAYALAEMWLAEGVMPEAGR